MIVLVHLNGAFTNEQCTIRIGLGRPKAVLVAAGIAEAKELLLNRTVRRHLYMKMTKSLKFACEGEYRTTFLHFLIFFRLTLYFHRGRHLTTWRYFRAVIGVTSVAWEWWWRRTASFRFGGTPPSRSTTCRAGTTTPAIRSTRNMEVCL